METETDILIIGAGLFGSVIGKWMEAAGHRVMMVDAEKSDAGSVPAACLIRPSWLSSFTKKQQAVSLALLDQCYGVRTLQADLPVGYVTVYGVPPKAILGDKERYTKGVVVQIGTASDGRPYARLQDGPTIWCNRMVVAAGIWCGKLVNCPPITAQSGAPIVWNINDLVRSPHGRAYGGPYGAMVADHMGTDYGRIRIRPYAPYKQLVALIRGPNELWVGDGTAVKPESLTKERIAKSLERCAGFLDLPPELGKPLVGHRPYVRSLSSEEPCLIKEVMPRVWVASGGAKNGLAAAGWAAYRFAEMWN